MNFSFNPNFLGIKPQKVGTASLRDNQKEEITQNIVNNFNKFSGDAPNTTENTKNLLDQNIIDNFNKFNK